MSIFKTFVDNVMGVSKDNGNAGIKDSVDRSNNIRKKQNIFLERGNVQSANNLNSVSFETFKPGVVTSSGRGAFLNASGLESVGAIDKLSKLFDNSRKSIEQRISLPGATLFLSGR